MVTRALPPELTDDEWRELGLDPNDPFRYGWRYVAHEQADGKITYEQVPLTLEDVLHPQEGYHIMQNEEHVDWCIYLYTVFRRLLAHTSLAVVFQDLLFLWDVPGLKGHAPDLAVVFGVRPGHRESFDVAAEGVRPTLIVEITSPSTANLDHQAKLEEYHLVGIPFYFIIDRRVVRRQRMLRLLGYRYTAAGYEPMVPNERGWLWMEPVRAWLGIAEGKPLCYTEEGMQIADYDQLEAKLSEAQERAEAAEARIRDLEATLRRLQQGE